jgi:hypothetical protein
MGHGRFILEACRSHTITHHSRNDSSGWGIGPSQRPLPDNTQHSQHAPRGIFSLFVLYPYFFVVIVLAFASCPYCTTHTTQRSMPPAGFEPAIPASQRPQTYALDRAATGMRTRNPSKRPAVDTRLNRSVTGIGKVTLKICK